MAGKTDNDNQENLKRYYQRLAELGKASPTLKQTKTGEPSMNEIMGLLALEGEQILKEEAKQNATKPKTVNPAKDESKKLDTALAAGSTNPYIRARAEVLKKLSAWKRDAIEKMEKENDLNNHIYQEFIHEVALLGDQLSEKK